MSIIDETQYQEFFFALAIRLFCEWNTCCTLPRTSRTLTAPKIYSRTQSDAISCSNFLLKCLEFQERHFHWDEPDNAYIGLLRFAIKRTEKPQTIDVPDDEVRKNSLFKSWSKVSNVCHRVGGIKGKSLRCTAAWRFDLLDFHLVIT